MMAAQKEHWKVAQKDDRLADERVFHWADLMALHSVEQRVFQRADLSVDKKASLRAGLKAIQTAVQWAAWQAGRLVDPLVGETVEWTAVQ